MPHTHHSHSGTYCAHADPSSSLKSMFQTALDRGFTVFAMTEHMPREDQDLYPEEIEAKYSAQTLATRFDEFVEEAVHLREIYERTGSLSASPSESPAPNSQPQSPSQHQQNPCTILIGLESEWLRPTTLTLLHSLLTKHSRHLDFILGSVHYVHTIPIDFDRTTYLRARAACNPPTDAQLFMDYFDAQFEMLRELRPRVVAHFDLIRLLADVPDGGWGPGDENEDGKEKEDEDGRKAIWGKIIRNLSFIHSYSGLLEINTSAWRKGLQDPYPRREIVKAWVGIGGDVVLSDDSHSVSQVGTNYDRLKGFLQECGVGRVAYLSREEGKLGIGHVGVEELLG